MNPLPLFILLTISQNGNRIGGIRSSNFKMSLPQMPTFDTFHMELMLDELHRAVNLLEKVNRMSQITREPITRERAPELLEAFGMPDVSNLVQNFAPMLQNYAPLLQMLKPSENGENIESE